jgi:hypothetical protein
MSNKLIADLMSFRARMVSDARTQVMFEGDFDTIDQAIATLRKSPIAAPIENVAEALEKAASIKVDYVVDQTDDPVRNKINGFINEAVETAINQYKQAIRSLIPDTQAKKGE